MGLVSLHQLCYIFVSQKFSFLSDPGFLNVPRGWGVTDLGNFPKFYQFCLVLPLTFVQTLSTLVKILKLKFRRDFEAEVWSVFCC